MASYEEVLADFIDNRSDPTKTSARYDEIIALRTFLFELREKLSRSGEPESVEARKLITERAKTWGKDDDCV